MQHLWQLPDWIPFVPVSGSYLLPLSNMSSLGKVLRVASN
jgi:hypothetical protein